MNVVKETVIFRTTTNFSIPMSMHAMVFKYVVKNSTEHFILLLTLLKKCALGHSAKPAGSVYLRESSNHVSCSRNCLEKRLNDTLLIGAIK